MPSAAVLRAGKAIIELTLQQSKLEGELKRLQGIILSSMSRLNKSTMPLNLINIGRLSAVRGVFGALVGTSARFAANLRNVGQSLTSIGTFGAGGGYAGLRNLFIGSAAAAGAAYPIKLAANLEVATAQLATFMSSEQAARDLLLDMQKFSAVSLVSFEALSQSTAMMLRFGVAEEQAGMHTKALAVLAAGSADEFDKLSLAFAQVASAGKLQGEEMRQFKNTAFNPIREIAERTGETMDDVRKRMEAGEISFQEVANALQATVGPGGRFAGLLERISNTLRGQLAKSLAQLKLAILPIGESVLKPITEFLKKINKIIPRIGEFIKNNTAWFVSLMKAAVGVAATAAGFVTLGLAATIVSIALGGLSMLITTLLPVLLVAGVLTAAVVFTMRKLGVTFTDVKNKARESLQSIAAWLSNLKSIASTTYRGVVAALTANYATKATEILWAGIDAAWKTGAKRLREIWMRFKFEFVRILLSLKFEVQRQWLSLTDWMFRQFLGVIDMVAHSPAGSRLWPELDKEVGQALFDSAFSTANQQKAIAAEQAAAMTMLDIAKRIALAGLATESEAARKELDKLVKGAENLAKVTKDAKLDLGLGKQFALPLMAGLAKAEEAAGASPIALFDTRLAAQSFGANPVQRQQLDELRKIRDNTGRRGGLPVV